MLFGPKLLTGELEMLSLVSLQTGRFSSSYHEPYPLRHCNGGSLEEALVVRLTLQVWRKPREQEVEKQDENSYLIYVFS